MPHSGCLRLHRRLDLRLGPGDDRIRHLARLGDADAAAFEIHRAGIRHDVQRGAAMHDAGEQRRMRNVVEAVGRSHGCERHRTTADLDDQLGGVFDGVDAVGRDRGVAGEPLERRAHAVLALVADDDLHLGRLADEGAERLDPFLRDLAQHRPHADAADLLVIGDRADGSALRASPPASPAPWQGTPRQIPSCRWCRGHRACRRARPA